MGIADFGTISLMAAFVVCLYGTVVPHLGVRTNNWNLIRSAKRKYSHLFSGSCRFCNFDSSLDCR